MSDLVCACASHFADGRHAPTCPVAIRGPENMADMLGMAHLSDIVKEMRQLGITHLKTATLEIQLGAKPLEAKVVEQKDEKKPEPPVTSPEEDADTYGGRGVPEMDRYAVDYK